ncbi:MAG: hypothetical protein HUK14_09800 [Muribaculaceae bacterium]|nr:hypothetical protein [Muribaculaceae bacterium]
MKKKFAAMMLLMLALANVGNAKSPTSDEFSGAKSVPGYVIMKDIPVSQPNDAQAPSDVVINAGKVCANFSEEESNFYDFSMPDVSESLIMGEDYITYFEPSQDSTPERYVKRAVFDKLAKKVTIYMNAPKSWRPGVTITLKPRIGEYISKVIIKPIVIKDKKAVYLEDGYYKGEVIEMYGKPVYELTYYYKGDSEEPSDADTDNQFHIYAFNGRELMKNNLDSKGDYVEKPAFSLKVSDSGYCSAKGMDEDAPFEPCSELSHYVVEIPALSLLGWISPTEVVIDNEVYDVVND